MPRILIVDDEESIRITIKEFLTDEGHEVQIAEDAITALELLKKTDFDVIVTDIILPRMSGVKLLKAIRDISKHVQVIMITGEPTIDTASDALRLGAFDYLAKPVTKEAIVRTVNNAAATKTLVDEKLRLEEDNLNYQKNLEKLVDKRTEDLWKSQHELKVRNRILEIFVSSPDDQLYSDLLEYILKLLKSEFGTFGYFGENGRFVVPSMTRKIFWDKCNVPEKEMIFNEGDFGGIWRKVIADRKTGFDNKGPFNVPEGHIEIFNTLVTPIVFKDELISAIHIANKRGGYDENDKILIETIASLIAPYLYNKLEKDKSKKLQKRTAEKLLNAAENWKTTFDAIEDLVGLISPDCEFVEVNKAMCDFTGLSPAELKGRKCYEVIHGTDIPIANCPVSKAKQSLKSEVSEIFQDGNYYAVSASPVIGEKGRITGFTHIVKDITDKKIAEQTLKVERDRAQQYLKIAEVMMLALDTEGQVVMINKKGCNILGYEEQEIIGKNWFDLCIPPETTREVKIVFDNLIHGNYDPVEYYENEILTKYQERRTIAFHNSVILNEADEITGILASGDDITDRKQAEEKIRKLSLAIEQSPSIVVITDPEGVIEYANPKFSQTTGYSSEEAIGEKIESIGEQSAELQKGMWKDLISGQEWKGEFFNKRKGGEPYCESAFISSIKNSEGIITNYIKVAEDITERKQA
ncbi:MAG: PAS domain S-box protein, partial [Calditrichaeota bacterium]|nr:PAS domain S-box protein [Calditrichota bacterium]